MPKTDGSHGNSGMRTVRKFGNVGFILSALLETDVVSTIHGGDIGGRADVVCGL